MNAQEYQELAARTLIAKPDAEYTPEQIMLVWNGLGVAGEAGEICDLLKKGIFHQHGVDVAKVREELGDLMWYVAAVCTKLDINLGDVMADNVAKLKRRYPAGYSSEASKARVDARFPQYAVDGQACAICGLSILLVEDGAGTYWSHYDGNGVFESTHEPRPEEPLKIDEIDQ